MSDTKETKPEGGGEQITIRVRDQVRKSFGRWFSHVVWRGIYYLYFYNRVVILHNNGTL